MLGIALRYGIKLEDLLVANPTINPRILSIGTVLIVPLPVVDAESTPTITPLPLKVDMPACYLSFDQDLLCLVEVNNILDRAVENLSLWVGLYNGNRMVESQIVVPALNILYAGERISLLAKFSGPLPAKVRPHAELLTALPVADDDTRYLPAQIETLDVLISLDGSQAQISGRVQWQPDQALPGTIWVVVVAYDEAGYPVGVRKLETRPVCNQDAADMPCSSLDVELTVYSLGPAIQTIEALVEARP